MVGSAAAASQFFHFNFHFPISEVSSTSIHLITTAASLRLSDFLRHRLHLSFSKEFSHLCHLPRLKDVWLERACHIKEFNFFQLSNDALSSECSSGLYFFNGGDARKDFGNKGMSRPETSRRNSLNGRKWTNIILAINVLIYVTQIATQGKLLLLGAKVNSLIDKGQVWRLITSSFLHANIGHLLVNSYSLNSVGPSAESICGPRRFLAVYFTSAIASSAVSYWFCKSPAVGASGAIFGLVGSVAVFVMRHRGLVRGGKEDLQHIANVIVLNMAIGLLSKGIDNWGHVGGLLGGAAVSWLIGPAWKYESLSNDGRKCFVDRAPISYFIKSKRQPGELS